MPQLLLHMRAAGGMVCKAGLRTGAGPRACPRPAILRSTIRGLRGRVEERWWKEVTGCECKFRAPEPRPRTPLGGISEAVYETYVVGVKAGLLMLVSKIMIESGLGEAMNDAVGATIQGVSRHYHSIFGSKT